MPNRKEGGVDTGWFITKAAENNWDEFDSRVLKVCNSDDWLAWTESGMSSPVLDKRDLAISILEKTEVALDGKKTEKLNIILTQDENTHLRRKAAIALWRHGNKNDQVLSRLKEALSDKELENEVRELLSQA
ncbi:MAG: hypothetical protein KJ915_02675 [Candidatus Omnitrophica bacterium]|nr:hypothetical protein [Candidatus Omnitrophota bacterium]